MCRSSPLSITFAQADIHFARDHTDRHSSPLKIRSIPEAVSADLRAAVCAGHPIGETTAEIEAVIAAAQRVLNQAPLLPRPPGAWLRHAAD
ncbi:hypothetical protein BOSE125_30264 [Bosea sp. 125]|nr:hypothetical protein BOSE125_30264 [Bosea sp. 125]